MVDYTYLIGLIALILVWLAIMHWVAKRRLPEGSKRPWIDYLILWPIILDIDKSARDGKFFTKREWIGWFVVLLLIAAQ